MSEEEKYALPGKMMTEKVGLERDIVLLEETFDSLREDVYTVGHMIPGEEVRYGGSSLPKGFQKYFGDGAAFLKLVSEWETKRQRISDLSMRITAASSGPNPTN